MLVSNKQKTAVCIRLKKEYPFSLTLNRFIEAKFDEVSNCINIEFCNFEPYKDFEDMRSSTLKSGTLKISMLHSDNTIFGDPLINYKFRAYHDYLHLTLQADFSPVEELRVNYRQQVDGLRYGLNKFDLQLLNIETAGQIFYFVENNDFPTDQRKFAISELQKSF